MISQIYMIRIDKCNNPGYWYSQFVGHIYYAGAINKEGRTYFKILNNKYHDNKMVSIHDASVIEQVTKVALY